MGGSKNKLKKVLSSLRSVRVWQLFLILIPLGFVVATLMRFDHLEMVKLRAAVLEADQAEDDEAIRDGLVKLRQFVSTHNVINMSESNGIQKIFFGTGPFYLERQYQRAAEKAIAEVEGQLVDDSNPNGNIYEAVRQICQPLALAYGWNWYDQGYINCWTEELAKYPDGENLSVTTLTAAVPSTELFRHNYASPVWAPSITGLVTLVWLILAIVMVIRILVWVILKIALVFAD